MELNAQYCSVNVQIHKRYKYTLYQDLGLVVIKRYSFSQVKSPVTLILYRYRTVSFVC